MYSFATGRRTASTQTVIEPEAFPELAPPIEAATSAAAVVTTATTDVSTNHRRLIFMLAPFREWLTTFRRVFRHGPRGRRVEARCQAPSARGRDHLYRRAIRA